MRQAIERRPSGRRRADYIVDSQGQALNARQARRSPLWTFALVGLAGVALTSPELAIGEAVLASGRAAAHGSEVLVASARAAVESAAELLRKRSPGKRTSAHLIKTKRQYAQARPGPTQRAKPRLRAPIPPPPFYAPPDAVPLAFADQPYVPGFLPIGGFPTYPVVGGGEGAPCYCAFGFIPPFFGGGGGLVLTPPGGGENPNPPNPPPPPPPGIPEPQNWAMMILGFGAVGTIWRKRRSLVAAIKGIPRITYAPIR